MNIDLQKIAEAALKDAARAAVESVIAKNVGYGLEGPLKDAIKDRAREILKEPEIENNLRKALINWIAKG